MAGHRLRSTGKNDKIPYYIIGAVVIIFVVIAFPKTGLFTTATETVGQGTVAFECVSVTKGDGGAAGSCDAHTFEEGNNVVAYVKFEDIKNVAGIDFELKTNYDGNELIDLDSVSLEKNCITPAYYECTEDSHCYGKCSDNECVSTIPTWNPGEESECFVTAQDQIPDCDSYTTLTAFTCPEINAANNNLDAGENCADRYYKSIMYLPSDGGIEVGDDDYAYVRDTVISDSSVGYAAGSSILKSNDGGDTWTNIADGQIGTGSYQCGIGGWQLWVRDIFFTDVNSGYLVSHCGKIFKTTDGGTTFTTSGDYSGNAVSFPSSNIGYIVGDSGAIFKTDNGGSTWSTQTSGTTNNLNDVYFKTATEGMIVGDSGTILYTTNGGSNWYLTTPQNTDLTSNTNDIYAIMYPASALGYRIVGASGTYSTSGWQQSVVTVRGVAQVSNDLFGIYAKGATLFAVGQSGTILKSSDGGANWVAKISKVTTDLLGVYFLDDNKGFVVGENEIILKTINGGDTWTVENFGTVGDTPGFYTEDVLFTVQFIASDYERECEALGGTYQSLGKCQITSLSEIKTNNQIGCELLTGTWLSGSCTLPADDDNDGIYNVFDMCPNSDTNIERYGGQGVSESGCSRWEIGDTNNDGYLNYEDTDGDKVLDVDDNCPNTPSLVVTNNVGCPDTNTNEYPDNGEFEIIDYRILPMSNGVTDFSLHAGEPKCGDDSPFTLTKYTNSETGKTTLSIQQDTNTIENYDITKLWVKLNIGIIKKGIALITLDDFNMFDKTGDTKLNTFDSLEAGSSTTIEPRDSDQDGTPDEDEPSGSNLAGTLFINDPTEWADSDGDGAGDNSDQCPNSNCGLDVGNCAANLIKSHPDYGCAQNELDYDDDGVNNMKLDSEGEHMEILDQCALTDWVDANGDGVHDTDKDDLGREVTFDSETGCTSDALFKETQRAGLSTSIRTNQVIFTDNILFLDLSDATKPRCTKTRTTTRAEWSAAEEKCEDFVLTLQFFDSKRKEKGEVLIETDNYEAEALTVVLPNLAPGEYNIKVSMHDTDDITKFATISDIPVRINMGDVNNDNKVDLNDILLLQRAVEGYGTDESLNLDINLDGEDANIGDLIKLKNIFMKR